MGGLSIDKGTTISIGLLIGVLALVLPAFFAYVTERAENKSTDTRQDKEITTLFTKIETLGTTLTETNNNLIRVNTQLETILGQSNQPASITIYDRRTSPQVVVASNPQSNQNQPTQNNPQPTQPSNPPQEEPEQPPLQPASPLDPITQPIGQLIQAIVKEDTWLLPQTSKLLSRTDR